MGTTKTLDAAAVWIGVATLSQKIDKSPVTIWRWCKAGTFPQPIYFGNRRSWCLADVEAWIAVQATKPTDPRHGAPTRDAAVQAP